MFRMGKCFPSNEESLYKHSLPVQRKIDFTPCELSDSHFLNTLFSSKGKQSLMIVLFLKNYQKLRLRETHQFFLLLMFYS